MAEFLLMSNSDIKNKRLLIREDFNVPMEEGNISNDERINRALPTIEQALVANARVMLMSHLGRPTEGKFDPVFSLAPIAKALSEKLRRPVPLVNNWLEGVNVERGNLVLFENVRFFVGEEENDPTLSKRMAQLCDIFVMDAFATAHRVQASTVGVAEYAPIACAGPLFAAEVDALTRALKNPKKPVVAIVGGSKVSTKIQLLENLLDKVDQLIVGDGIANTFLKAQGYRIGKSLCEDNWIETATRFWETAKSKSVSIPLPVDVVVAKELSASAKSRVTSIEAVADDESIFDVGPQTAKQYAPWMAKAGTIVWNGPVGVFEMDSFSQGTRALAQAIAQSHAYSIAGGGDTVAAVQKFDVSTQLSYISTAGGAFLEFLEGKTLPAIKILTERFSSMKSGRSHSA